MAKSSRRHRQKSWQAKLLAQSWLIIPIGVIALVVGLGLTQGRQERQGLVDIFVADTLGGPSPPRSDAEEALPGEAMPDEGAAHVPEGQPVVYNTNPPTSGNHWASTAAWGIYNEPPPDEQLVHNLEHGGIIVSYHPEQIDDNTLNQLRRQVRRLSRRNPRIILTPRESLSVPIALTAWGFLKELDSYDPDRIDNFYDVHIAQGPECQEGRCPP